MKKVFKKILCISILGISILSCSKAAYASGEYFSDSKTKTYYCSGNLKWHYNQTRKCWNFGDSVNDEQFKDNCWVYDSGKWYFIGRSSAMVTDMCIYDSGSGNSYYIKADGTMATNEYCTPKTGSGQFEWKAYADSSGKLT